MTPLDQHPNHRRRSAVIVVAVFAAAGVLAAVAVPRVAAHPRPRPGAAPPTSSAPSAAAPDDPCRLPAPLSPQHLRDLARETTTRPTHLPASTPAREPLDALTIAIVRDRCDTETGAYEYLHIRQWAADTTITRSRADTTTILLEEQRWRADDGSGRVISTRYPAIGDATTDQAYPAGGLAAVSGPLSTDPALLAAQFNDIQPSAVIGPQAGLRALADINSWHIPDLVVRAAAIGVLRDTDGLRYHGSVTDRAGRTGAAVSATSGDNTTRDLIILDPRTGNLLGYELTMLRNPGQPEAGPAVQDYVLYLARTRTL